MKTSRLKQLAGFEERISYNYKNISLLDIAFTHSSYSNENKNYPYDNERLEFLGDSVVNLIVTDILFEKNKELPEGDLTKIRSCIICEDAFAKASLHLNIPNYILLGRGEEKSGGRQRKSLIADAFEAFCGSLYLDSDFNTTKKIITRELFDLASSYLKSHNFVDYKTMVQEEIQKNNKGKIRYDLVKETGPDHDKFFYFNLLVDGEVVGTGQGKNKKQAEQDAAYNALTNMGIINER